jgi:hypothetical protein
VKKKKLKKNSLTQHLKQHFQKAKNFKTAKKKPLRGGVKKHRFFFIELIYFYYYFLNITILYVSN